MAYRWVVGISVMALVQSSAAAEIDAAYLHGSQPSHDVTQMPAQEWNVAPDHPGPISPAVPIAVASPSWSWSGFYGGGHAGAVAGVANFADPFGASIFGDNVNTPGFLGGGQLVSTGKYQIRALCWGSRPMQAG
jgi:hypothetical protein